MLTPANDVYKDSPNRYVPTITQTQEEIIENYISKIAGMNVDFGESNDNEESLTFHLNLQESVPMHNSNEMMVATYRKMLSEIIKVIKDRLRDGGYTNPQIDERFVEVSPGMYRSAGYQTIFHIRGCYTLSK